MAKLVLLDGILAADVDRGAVAEMSLALLVELGLADPARELAHALDHSIRIVDTTAEFLEVEKRAVDDAAWVVEKTKMLVPMASRVDTQVGKFADDDVDDSHGPVPLENTPAVNVVFGGSDAACRVAVAAAKAKTVETSDLALVQNLEPRLAARGVLQYVVSVDSLAGDQQLGGTGLVAD